MNLIIFLLRVSWRAMIVATVAGLLSGASSIGLIALINATPTRRTDDYPVWINISSFRY